MPLFRRHRGGLQESLATTIIVHSQEDIINSCLSCELTGSWQINLLIEPYWSEGNNFDSRIGWYTQMVTGNLYCENEWHIIGFLSEPLKEK